MVTEHELKTWPEYFQAIVEGRKPFEYRLNDRDFKVGDVLHLREWVPPAEDDELDARGGHYTGRELRQVVTYILDDRLGPTMRQGFVVMGIASGEAILAAAAPSFQARVLPWMLECFGEAILADGVERNYRFLEESLELVQATGLTRNEAHELVEYTFNRDVGDPHQEVGGVMVCLAALCICHGLDMHADGETELLRILRPEIIEKIRAKQATKPRYSPLPGYGSTS